MSDNVYRSIRKYDNFIYILKHKHVMCIHTDFNLKHLPGLQKHKNFVLWWQLKLYRDQKIALRHLLHYLYAICICIAEFQCVRHLCGTRWQDSRSLVAAESLPLFILEHWIHQKNLSHLSMHIVIFAQESLPHDLVECQQLFRGFL
jgi:hypothetical protein